MAKNKGSWGWKADIEKRCMRVNLWEKFKGLREGFKKQGSDHVQAWEKAWLLVEPLVAGAESAQGLGALVEDPQPKTIVLQQNYRERLEEAKARGAAFGQDDPNDATNPPEVCNASDAEFAAAVKFTFNNMRIQGVRRDQCAHIPGAFALWSWANASAENEKQFYTVMVPKVMPKDASEKDSQAIVDDGRKQLDVIATLKAKGVTA